MLNKIVYTYYRWYILLSFAIACTVLSLIAVLIYHCYQDPSSGYLFWFFTGIFILSVLLSTFYLTHITSYRLVLKDGTLREWRKTLPFGNSKLRSSIVLPDADNKLSSLSGNSEKNNESKPNAEISIFCNGFAPIRQRLSLRKRLIMQRCWETTCPPVPSLPTFRRHQRQCLTVFGLVPTILVYIALLQFSVHPIFNVFAYVLFVSIISYLWYTFSKLPKIYFSYTLEVVKPPIPFVLLFLTILFLYSVLLKFSIASYIPLAVSSFILTVILHWRYSRLLYSHAYYITFLCLPFVLFSLLIIINCAPTGKPTESVQMPIYAKKHRDSFPPHFAVDIDIWGDGKPTGFDLKKSIYDQVEVRDTLSFRIYRGLLGIRWVEAPSANSDFDILKAKP
ncbi:hypothetical protein [Sphingobacterium haloxyli]|uniref:Uncharacterized protein n=1 Tax=Sphingobacterium haloxyli TaxID=2100533 RepID=A0A2S9J295_9SPHI|nr:hypothetical protein [Sphingobacterium haloxyli]PRD46908.1 hypothetical protein C5745_12470 [Sphingobacterium haloxyli]